MTDTEQPSQWAVKEIETVTGDFLTELGAPFYRIEIDGYCADFDYREAAENFASAIQRAFAAREAELVRSTLAMLADHMTSEKHHPGYVLVPTSAFEKMRSALKSREASHG